MSGLSMLWRVGLVALVLTLGACGGGGEVGSDAPAVATDDELRLSVDRVDLKVRRLGQVETWTLAISFSGLQLEIGYPPGVPPPSWLSPGSLTRTGFGRVSLPLTATTNLAPGTYRTTLRFLNRGARVSYRDLPVELRVFPRLSVEPSDVVFMAYAGMALPPAQSVRVESDEPLAFTVTPTGSSASAPVTFVNSGNAPMTASVRPTTTNVSPGVHDVTFTLNTAEGPPVSLVARYGVDVPPMNVSPGNLAFEINASSPAAAFVRRVTISDDSSNTDFSWRLMRIAQDFQTDATWLSADQTSGNTAENSPLTIRLVKRELGNLRAGLHRAELWLEADITGASCCTTGPVIVPITLNMNVPSTKAVGPGTIDVSHRHGLLVHGSGLQQATNSQMHIGDVAVPEFEILNDTLVRVPATPELPVGLHRISITNPLGIDNSTAVVRVVETPDYPAAQLPVSQPIDRLLQDPAVPSLLYYDEAREAIRSWVYEAGWSSQDLRSVQGVRDLVPARYDGMIAVATSRQVLFTRSRSSGATYGPNAPAEHCFTGLGALLDGSVWAGTQPCSGSPTATPSYRFTFDLFAPQSALAAGPMQQAARARVGAGLGHMILGPGSSSPGLAVDLLHDAPYPAPAAVGAFDDLGSRFISWDAGTSGAVYDRNYTLLGTLRDTSGNAPLLALPSPDAERAWALFDAVAPSTMLRLAAYDISAAASNGTYVPMSIVDTEISGGSRLLDATMARNGRTLFVLGSEAIYVLPLSNAAN